MSHVMTFGSLRLWTLSFVVAIVLAVGPQSAALAQNTPSVGMPPNYRSLIAHYMRTQMPVPRDELNTAMISQPYGKWGGMFRGGTMPTVCVSIKTKNMLGMHFTGYFLFTVENGRVRRLGQGTNAVIDKCPPFSPFHEVRR
jgi:hypothetical protein